MDSSGVKQNIENRHTSLKCRKGFNAHTRYGTRNNPYQTTKTFDIDDCKHNCVTYELSNDGTFLCECHVITEETLILSCLGTNFKE